ncbi:MAG: hypothetical protein JNL65_11425 [Saprospiraceae bacterium]|nr:hypothetical protein [Saprospiraceae bacterium]
MASLQKVINDLSGADEKAAQAKERLELLKNSAQAHLQLAENKISEALLGNSGGISKLFIVPDTVLGFQQGYTVSSSETIDAGLDTAIDQFFSGNTKDGFKTVVKSGLSALFADTTTGETLKDYYFVAMEHNSFIRVDVSIWKFYFSQKSIQDTVQQAFCYTFCKSIIDHKKVSLDTIIYLVSSYIGDDLTKIQSYLDAIKSLYAAIEPIKPSDVAKNALKLFQL